MTRALVLTLLTLFAQNARADDDDDDDDDDDGDDDGASISFGVTP